MTHDDARQLALAKLRTYESPEELVLLDSQTVERPYGWVFFYNSRRFVETGNVLYALAGNGPLLVCDDGSITVLGTAHPLDVELRTFEKTLAR